jgi:ketosteroid isomerase-like protein
MTINLIQTLPAMIKRFFEASNRHDTAATIGCFTRDVTLEDQFGEYVGRAAVENRLIEVNHKFRPAFAILRVKPTEADVGLVVSVSGDFPGSPVQLDFHFQLRGGKISALTMER